MDQPPKRTSPERRLNGAAVLIGLYGVSPLLSMGSELLDLWNAFFSGMVYTVPALTIVFAIAQRRSWARLAGLIVSGVWIAVSVFGSVTAVWWFLGDREPGVGLDLWNLVFRPTLLLIAPAVAILLLLSSPGVAEALEARRPEDSERPGPPP